MKLFCTATWVKKHLLEHRGAVIDLRLGSRGEPWFEAGSECPAAQLPLRVFFPETVCDPPKLTLFRLVIGHPQRASSLSGG